MRKNIEERLKDKIFYGAKNNERKKDSYEVLMVIVVFVASIAFWLGLIIAEYQAQKHLDEIELPKCNCAIETPEKLESLEVVEENAGY